MLEMLSSQEESTGFFNDVLSGHSTPEINIELEEEGEAQSLVEKTMLNLKSIKGQVVTVDGIRIEETDAWGLMRRQTPPEFSSSFRGRHCGIIKTDPTDLQKFDNDIKTKYRTSILGKKMDKNLNNTAKL